MHLAKLVILGALLPLIAGSGSFGAPQANVVYTSNTVAPAAKPQNFDSRTKKSSLSRRWRNYSSSQSDDKTSGNNKEEHAAAPSEDISGAQQFSPNQQHLTQFIAECNMPTIDGFFKMRSYTYNSPRQSLEPVAMIAGNVRGGENVLVRVHDQCFTSEVFGSLRCDCKEQLQRALQMITDESTNDEGSGGIVIYLQQEGRGIGLANKVAAYALQDQGMDTVEANTHLGFEEELREYFSVPDILKDLGIKSIRLITNNPYKIDQLKLLGVQINDRVPLQIQANEFNERYLRSKKDKMHHWLRDDLIDAPFSSAALREAKRRASAAVTDTYDSNTDDQDGSTSVESQKEVRRTTNSPVDSAPKVNKSSGLKRIHAPNNSNSTTTPDDTHNRQQGSRFSQIASRGVLVMGGSTSTQLEDEATAAVVAAGDDSIEERKAAAIQECGGYVFGKKTVEDAIADIKAGKPVIVVDDADRENEGDLILAAEKATAESVGYIVRYSSGVICISLEEERLKALKLPPMVIDNEDPKQTAYSVSVDHRDTSTGISAADRALTFRKLVDPTVSPEDFQRPGHVFPLRYKEGGVRSRAGHTEASLDLTRLAGLQPGGVLAEIVHDDGSMQRLPDLERMAADHNLVLTSVQDIIAYRVEQEFEP